jgi:hypothetical protein
VGVQSSSETLGIMSIMKRMACGSSSLVFVPGGRQGHR